MDILKNFAPFAYIVNAAAVAGIVWIGFDQIEKTAGGYLRNRIRSWLLSRTPNWKELLPQSLFLLDNVFGEKHFTWHCFWRSSLISIVAFTIFSSMLFEDEDLFFTRNISFKNGSLLIAMLAGLNLIADFVSLLESRWVLKHYLLYSNL